MAANPWQAGLILARRALPSPCEWGVGEKWCGVVVWCVVGEKWCGREVVWNENEREKKESRGVVSKGEMGRDGKNGYQG